MTQATSPVTAPLGEAREIRVPGGRIRVFERGQGEPIVFLHGLLVSAAHWRKVVPRLAADFRCVTLDLPLGSHTLAMEPGADLSTPGLARIVAAALEELDLDDVTLVGNDTGGAVAQLVAVDHPQRIGRLVLTSCDAFEHFPPGIFKYLLYAGRVPGALKVLGQTTKLGFVRNSPLAYGWATKRRIESAVLDSYTEPGGSDPAIRRDLRRVLGGISKEHTLDAAARLSSFDKPALIAWGAEDRFFPFSDAERLAAVLPDSRVERIEDSRTFTPEDRPDALADLIVKFVREKRSAAAAA